MHCIYGLALVFNVGDFLGDAHQHFHCFIKQIHDRVDNKSSAQETYFQSTREVQLAWLARIVSQNRPLNRVHLQHRSSFWWPFDRWTVVVWRLTFLRPTRWFWAAFWNVVVAWPPRIVLTVCLTSSWATEFNILKKCIQCSILRTSKSQVNFWSGWCFQGPKAGKLGSQCNVSSGFTSRFQASCERAV